MSYFNAVFNSRKMKANAISEIHSEIRKPSQIDVATRYRYRYAPPPLKCHPTYATTLDTMKTFASSQGAKEN